MEQTNPATTLVERIVEMLVARTPEKTQQFANTFAQHAVDTVEVERLQIIKQTWQKPIIQDKINQVTRHVEVPQVQFLNKVNEMPVGVQRQIPMVPIVQKTMEIPQLQCIDESIDDPVVQVVEKTVEGPQFQIVDKSAEDLQTETNQGTQTSESSGNASFHQASQAAPRVQKIVEMPKGAVLGRRGGHASRHTTSGAHDPERAEDCGGAADPVLRQDCGCTRCGVD